MKEYNNDGILINLEDYIVDYNKLLMNPEKYLDKNQKYYIYCKKGIKSRKVVSILEIYGYNVTRIIN